MYVHLSFSKGIRIFDDRVRLTDARQAFALSHELDKIDIYSNSWGPGDTATEVEGPETLTQRAIERGIKQVMYRFSQAKSKALEGCFIKCLSQFIQRLPYTESKLNSAHAWSSAINNAMRYLFICLEKFDLFVTGMTYPFKILS